MSQPSPIAVVGRACVLPQASTPTALWDLVAQGKSAVTAVPGGRFGMDPDLARGTPKNSIDKTWSTRGGYVTDDVGTDFKGSDDVKGLDPLFAWTLRTAHLALRDAGFDDGVPANLLGGCVLGNLSFPTAAMTRLGENLALDEVWRNATKRSVGDKRDRFMSGLPALLVAQHLNTHAFAFSLDAACASSLYAIHLAMRALQAGRADVVVAGAVNRADSLFLHVGFSALQALSTSGTPRPFDKGADGLVPAEGCALVALMRLDDALAAGKTIHGVLRGSALSNDGRSKNLLAPASDGQVRALRGAWNDAGLDPETASYFECHATGTQTGDRVEVESVVQLLAGSQETRQAPTPLGSLKSNLGHLITAAGAAGLIKVLEAFKHEQLPPTLGVREAIDVVDNRVVCLQQELSPWPSSDNPRRAGVSAFGFGGNDAHLVVEEAPRTRSFTSGNIKATPLPRLAITAFASRIGDHTAINGAFADGVGAASDVVIDADGVRFPPNDLKECLAQQLLIFEAAREAAAGFSEEALPQLRTGIFIGMGTDMQVTTPGLRWRAEDLAHTAGVDDASFVATLRDLAMPPMNATGVLGCMPNIPANRLSVQLDLRGPGFTLSSEQRSGIDAFDTARALIAAHDIDAAIVGAVDACADDRHVRCTEGRPGADAAVAFVVMSEERAASLRLPILAVIGDPEGDASADTAATFGRDEVTAAIGDAHAASDLVAVAAAVASFGSTRVSVSNTSRMLRVTTSRSARRDDVAVLFGPVTSTPSPAMTTRWTRFPAVAAEVRRLFGPVSAEMLAGRAGSPGCERELFTASIEMQARHTFLRDVLGVSAGHHVGVSLGESNALVAAGVWRDPAALFADTVASRLFVDDVAGDRAAVRAFWRGRGRAELGNAWSAVVVRAHRSRVEALLQGRDDVFATMWHTDDEGELAGAPDAVDEVVAALGGFAVPLTDAPAVHSPALTAAAERYRALHHRAVGATDVVIWSNGVGTHGGRLNGAGSSPGGSDVCADAIVTQASRTVDVPALIRQVAAAGVRIFVDASPRGLMAQWIRRLLPDAVVIAIDGAPGDVARRCAEAGLLSSEHFSQFWKQRNEPKRSLRVPAHRPPRPWPAPSSTHRAGAAMNAPAEKMTPPKKTLPRLTSPTLLQDQAAPRAEPQRLQATSAPTQTAAAVAPPAQMTSAQSSPPRLLVPIPAPAPAKATATATTTTTDPDEQDALLAAVLAQRAALQQAHTGFLETAERGHAAFLRAQQSLLSSLPQLSEGISATHTELLIHDGAATDVGSFADEAPTQAPPPQQTPQQTPTPARAAATSVGDVMFTREQLISLSTDKLSTQLGPLFQRQDGFRRQVRMPRPPLLLADRVLSTTATPGKLEKGKKIITATDVRADAWYLHEARVPAGVLIETGQADLLLISLMGVDFENRGERVYRLLGCDLAYGTELPRVGSVLHHDIVIDGHATAAISATSEARIFFFHSETRLGGPDGPLVLTVKNGQAGFFTDEELLHSGGILWKPEDENQGDIAALAHTTPAMFTTKTSLSRQELLAWSHGDAVACFGAGFEFAATHVRTPRIDPPRRGGRDEDPFGNPDGRLIDMLLIDRVTELSKDAGPWQRGSLRAELDLHAGKWFYDGHFQDDPCMPGTIMFQGCLQVASTWLAACGLTLKRDGFRFEPRHGALMPLRCRGQATPTSTRMVYELFVKALHDGAEPFVRCDILVTVFNERGEGLKALHCKDVELALVADFPLSSQLGLQGLTTKPNGRDAISPHSVVSTNAETGVTGFTSLLSTGIGRPGAAFPGLYDVYDDGRPVARLPGPPYHFMSNVDDIRGPAMGALVRGEDPKGTRAVVRYDVPRDAWYFKEAGPAQGRNMPFAVLLEVALQPCGWLSSYVGSTRTSEQPLKYRNLDGKAVQHKEVGDDVGALLTTAVMTKSSSSSGMIIQEFTFEVKDARGDRVFDGSTVFGFFPDAALAVQVGVGSSEADKARLREAGGEYGGGSWSFDGGNDAAWASTPTKLRLPRNGPGLQGEPILLMLDRVDAVTRKAPPAGKDPRGHLRVRTSKDVVLGDWFFKAHFFQDPVQPGSLGIEAMVQAIQWIAAHEGLDAGMKRPRFEALALGAPLVWKYRGQVVPKNKLIQVEVDVSEVVVDGRGVTVVADGALWVDGLRIYLAKGLAVRIVDEG